MSPVVSPTRFANPFADTADWVYYCDLCGEKGERPKNKLEAQKERAGGVYCSRECRREYEFREKWRWNCMICGERLVWTDQYEYCSEPCREMSNERWYHHGQMTIEYSFRIPPQDLPFGGSLWKDRREEALERDGYQCQRCGIGEKEHREKHGQQLHVHHIIRRRAFVEAESAHALNNLVTLCATCHGVEEHSGDSKTGVEAETP